MIATRQGTFFTLAPAQALPDVALPPTYSWSRFDESTILTDPLYAVKGRRETARMRLARGHHCYGFRDESGAVAYSMWVTLATEERPASWELRTRVAIPPQSGYLWDCFTDPGHRRQGLYRAGLIEATKIARRAGAGNVFISSLADNRTSVAAIQSVGFREVFSFRLARLGPFVVCNRSGRVASVKMGSPLFHVIDVPCSTS